MTSCHFVFDLKKNFVKQVKYFLGKSLCPFFARTVPATKMTILTPVVAVALLLLSFAGWAEAVHLTPAFQPCFSLHSPSLRVAKHPVSMTAHPHRPIDPVHDFNRDFITPIRRIIDEFRDDKQRVDHLIATVRQMVEDSDKVRELHTLVAQTKSSKRRSPPRRQHDGRCPGS